MVSLEWIYFVPFFVAFAVYAAAMVVCNMKKKEEE